MDQLDTTSREFLAKPLAERRRLVALQYGLSWEEYSRIPADKRVAMRLASQGHTYTSGVGEGVEAAQADARWNTLSGFFSGLKFGSTGIMLAAVIGVAIIFQKPILRQLKKVAA